MDFALSEEQLILQRTVRSFLEQRSPEGEVRRLMEETDGYDPAIWLQMATELGLQGIAVPEEYGGSGYSFRELSIVLEEMGRALLVAPFFSSAVLATSALLHSGHEEAKREFLPGISSGKTLATLAVTEVSGSWTEAGVEMVATPGRGRFSLSGSKGHVLDGSIANLILVAARTAAGIGLFAVTGDAPGLTRCPLATMDQTRKLARLDFESTPARLVGQEAGGWPSVEHALQLAAVGLAAEQVGGAQKCLEISVEYAKHRIQFGRPIGSFQAVKHMCAGMLIDVELAKTASHYASACAADLDPDLPIAASMAKSFCSTAYLKVASEAIQVHGGIGFTWEHPCHLYFKRAKSSEVLFGDPRFHGRRLLGQLGIQ
jgi:alkylation response protein AidB-like acyl-CoA dehydrogenase